MKPGTRLWSRTSSTSLVVVRPPARSVVLTCDGVALLAVEQPMRGDAPADAPRTMLGKRYGDTGSGLEVLCTRAGAGVLAADGQPLLVLSARALPASD